MTRFQDSGSRQIAEITRPATHTAANAVLTVDAHRRVVLFNRAAERLFECDAAAAIGAPLSRFIPDYVSGNEQRYFERYVERDGSSDVAAEEILARRQDGALFPIETSVSRLEVAGELIYTIIVRDVTETKRQDAAARLLASIVDSSSDAIASKDLRGIVTSWNQGAVRMLGWSAEEMIGQSIRRIIPADRIPEEEMILSSVALGELVEAFETERLHKDGHLIPVSVTVSPIRNSAGVIVGASKVVRDITQRKQGQARLKESDARFRHLAESLPQLIWSCDANGACDYLSRQWEDYTGIPAASQLGHGWLDRVHHDDRLPLIDAWTSAVETGREFHFEFRIQRRDGQYHWFDARGTPQRDEAGRVVRWFGANADIEDQMLARESQVRMQKLEALGTLAGGIAHDFNNILLAICGNTSLALEECQPGHPLRENLEEIDHASRRAVDLVRRILSFSRQDEPRREIVVLRSVVQEVLKLMRATLPAQIELRAKFEPGTPPTLGDASQVHQVLMNLLTNAAHAIGDGPGLIQLSLGPTEVTTNDLSAQLQPGAYACLVIEDSGCGMSHETLERIFDPFFTTKPPGLGTGLGLSVVDGIMKSHGGAVTVESKRGAGSVFKLFFPATENRVATHIPAPGTAPDSASDSVQGRRLLYVDDDAALVRLVVRKLTRLGYTVTGLEDPERALELVSQDPGAFDAVVSDLSMPRMPGFELGRRILELRPSMPIVITSGFVRPEDEERARELGVRAFILKPQTIDELGNALNRIFSEG
jgi:PAS domain S-box-containing protein